MCSPRLVAAPFDWVCHRVPGGTRGSHAPSRRPGGRLPRGTVSGGTLASYHSPYTLPYRALPLRIRAHILLIYSTRRRRLRGYGTAFAVPSALHYAPTQGAYIFGHPPGTRWGLSSYGRPGHRLRTPARVMSVVLGWPSPPYPPIRGVLLRPGGRRLSVLRTVSGWVTCCSSFV